MKKGAIFNHLKFTFQDGTIGNKYIILLNTPVKNEPYLFCKTTSHCKYSITNEGCHAEKCIYLLKPHRAKCLSCDTWVQLDHIFEYDGPTLLHDKFTHDLKKIGELDSQTTSALVNCIKKTDDISQHHLDLIGA